ncbi:MAG: protein kinase family protein [Candidatus Thorarchaeota archaeon]
MAGKGANAETYHAMCTEPKSAKGEFYAIKFFTNIDTPGRIEAFLQEYQFLKTFSHHYIMKVMHLGYFEDVAKHPFIVADYFPETLKDVMESNPTTTQKAIYAIQILSALGHIYNLGKPIIHRDIKPANIFRKGSDCILGDFGLAKQQSAEMPNEEDWEEDVRRLKMSHGTGMPRNYRSPDHIRYYRNEEMITTSADIYQMGLVLTELFTGNNPLPPPPEGDLTIIVDCDSIPYIDDPVGGLIHDFLCQMLEPEPKDRPTAFELIDRWETVMKKSKRYEAVG